MCRSVVPPVKEHILEGIQNCIAFVAREGFWLSEITIAKMPFELPEFVTSPYYKEKVRIKTEDEVPYG